MKEKTLHTELRELFEANYNDLTASAYYWTPRDAKGLKQMIAKLTFLVEIKRKDFTDEDIKEAFLVIIYSIKGLKELQFYRENFSISIINSKLNDIIATIRNGKSNSKNRRAEELQSDNRAVETKSIGNWRDRFK